MPSPFLLIHIASAQDERQVFRFVQKKNDKVATCIRLSAGRIDIFTDPVTRLNETELWTIEKYFLYLVLSDMMLDSKLFHNVWEPNDVVNIHDRDVIRSLTVNL